jgi:hypothetical protein
MGDVEDDLELERQLVALVGMWLPPGFRCGDCEGFVDCTETKGALPEWTICEETPSRFRPAGPRQKR